MGHPIVLGFLVGFAVATLAAAAVAIREHRRAAPLEPGEPPPPAGTAADRRNKWGTVAAICGLMCALAAIALAFNR